MMKLKDKDIDPMTDCNFEAMGNTTKEVAMKMMDHMKEVHPDKLEAMAMSDDELMKMFQSKVHA